ncbi:LSU ribosomal protein L9P [Salana multivorans]|uniref:Large ribosomal subunit protein bL9 n=1 Tax=Salana multivorans TaxID=120377 RepID=A0A3N2DA12_9MICO|nr:50S ribosomal protein L9 [Salana multivorans]MBN8882182.1 50S ribosomal protein L9 [Salana multivorans]OJX95348.1 MAG: 50S ribosomal protein L9 [Micrococcales bacterium 73-15]ROR96641.1 LSU ribosomal protein L9P [Salana multivorans]
MTTKLILTHEVTGLGTAGDVVEVKDGYARNYLVPRGLGQVWSRGAEKQIEGMRASRAKKAHASVEAASAVRDQLEATRYTVTGRAGAGGRLFGTVTSKEIAASVKAAGGPDLDRRSIEVKQHIKTLGTHAVTVHLHDGVTAKLTLEVVPA